MDYWKDVPGINEALSAKNILSAMMKLIKSADSLEFAMNKVELDEGGKKDRKKVEGSIRQLKKDMDRMQSNLKKG
ncbi:MAG: hypothetical protein DRP51_10075 [Candidatus Zixiibacteriota bacterium]|nr:MAG: hypothetical protein DRP51_10075 [candidate division Zixibacteria bacterium]